jgi:hypothetical protein
MQVCQIRNADKRLLESACRGYIVYNYSNACLIVPGTALAYTSCCSGQKTRLRGRGGADDVELNL